MPIERNFPCSKNPVTPITPITLDPSLKNHGYSVTFKVTRIKHGSEASLGGATKTGLT